MDLKELQKGSNSTRLMRLLEDKACCILKITGLPTLFALLRWLDTNNTLFIFLF